ncbi:hypothetical protein N431DRAFT_104390 [Stipitochalara longipes BDJ]|nr:hypothetical protein N431DRAFT_104390 [Stipitochalara longipes BDJ]
MYARIRMLCSCPLISCRARLPATFGAAFGTLVNTDGSDGPGPALDNPDDEKLKGQVNSMRVAYAALNNNQPFSPVRRDTIMIERGWDYIIAVKANNPGVWALHCHNDFHASTGMFMQIIEQPTLIRSTFTRWVAQTIQPTTAQCPNPITMDLSTQGNFSDGWNNFQNNRSIDVPWPAMEQLYRTTMEWQGKGDVCWEYNDF